MTKPAANGGCRGVRPDSGRSAPAEKGLQQFAGFLVLPPAITPAGYGLRTQRQSGAPPLPVTVSANGATAAQTVAGNTWDWIPD